MSSSLLSEKGATFAFDHRAKSGFARGEGTGCVILKPLDQALKDGDKVWSVVVNTGVNQDGKTVGKFASYQRNMGMELTVSDRHDNSFCRCPRAVDP